MYIAFPIGWMYYFGTNLDNRFSVPDFWPKPEETNKVPFDREDIGKELEALRARRLRLREERLKTERVQEEMNKERETMEARTEGAG